MTMSAVTGTGITIITITMGETGTMGTGIAMAADGDRTTSHGATAPIGSSQTSMTSGGKLATEFGSKI
jgi:hypothetical protein